MEILFKICDSLKPLVAPLLGTFAGAFLAFYFGQLTEKIKRYRDRWRDHHNALVNLESILNENLRIISDNIHLIENVLSIKIVQNCYVPLIWDEPHKVLPENRPDLPFLRPDIINDFFSYRQSVQRINNDSEKICNIFVEMRSSYICKDIGRIQYSEVVSGYQKKLKTLQKGYKALDETTIKLQVNTRAAIREDKERFKGKFYRLPVPINISNEQLAEERKKLDEEIESIRDKSRKEIERFQIK